MPEIDVVGTAVSEPGDNVDMLPVSAMVLDCVTLPSPEVLLSPEGATDGDTPKLPTAALALNPVIAFALDGVTVPGETVAATVCN